MALRIVKWAGIAAATLVLLIVLGLLAVDTGPGRRFVVDRLAGYSTASGLNFRASRIDGSIYGRMVLHDVEVRDPRGMFASIPRLTVDWRPFSYLHSKVDVRLLQAPTALLLRKPELKSVPADPDAPLLPDLDIALGKIEVGQLTILPPVTGQRHALSLRGSANIADRRAQIRLDAQAVRGSHLAGGDRLHLILDAVPDDNRLAIDADLRAPAGGLVDSYGKFGKPLMLTVKGSGDWAHWRGEARGALGGASLGTLALNGTNGTFETKGVVRPSLLLSGPSAQLTTPAVTLDLVAKLADRKIDARVQASSDYFSLHSEGQIDLGNSRFGDLRVDARLLNASALAPNLHARDLRLQAKLDGALAAPTTDYQLTAGSIGFGDIRVAGLSVRGDGVIDTNHIRIPVHATAGAISGLNAAAGGLLKNIRLDGDIAYQDGKVASDNLHLRSTRIDATAIILADLTKGTYTGALKGRVNDYEVNGLGKINLVTDARLVPGAGGGFAVKGHVKMLTRRLDNASVREQLGGNAFITADIAYDLARGATVTNLRLRAPRFQIVGGNGFYRTDGRIGFHARGRSDAYGPIRVDVTGTVARPLARLRADRPGLGLGLRDLDAMAEGTNGGYRIRARGQSDYGPLSADAVLTVGNGATRVDIASATIAGIRVSGQVQQAPAGPFVGTLALVGSGLSGNIRLSAAGSIQRADVALTAAAARIPGTTPITIGSGTMSATVMMEQAGPSIEGRFALQSVRSATLEIARARGRITYRAGQGRVALVAAGAASGTPFDIASQAALAPTRVVANLTGHVSGVAFRLAAPAIATKVGTDWRLAPTTIIVPQGQMELTGGYGARTQIHAVLRNMDIAIVNAVVPGLGLGGKASGTVDADVSGAVPDVRARIDVTGFNRTAALTVSDPVDIALLGTLNQTGGDVRALIKRSGAVLGRMQARLAPLGAGAGISERLFSAPLSGGIRYNGPAEVLWSMSGIARQDLSGPIAIGADFGGRLDRPTVTGVIRANALRYENEAFGTVLSRMAIDGRFTQSQLLLNRLTASAGEGSIAASGQVGLDAASGFPIDVKVTLDRAHLARGDDLDATVSGNLAITNSKGAGGLIKGELRIPEARYQIVREGSAAVPELTGVRRKGDVAPAAQANGPALPSNWKLDVRLRADNQIFVSGMGLEAEWRTDMRVRGTSTDPSIVGKLEVVRGTYSFAGRRFELDHGTITFQGGMMNPQLDIAASTTVEGVSATITIGGYAQRPQISFTSTPSLPQDEVLSRLLFGTSITSLSPTQAIQLAAALNSLRGSGGGLNPLGKLRGLAGIDRLRVLGADQSAGRGTALAAGKYISNNIYVEIVTDARGFTATQLEISLSRALSVLSQTGSFGGSNVSLRYKKVY
ncbi:translocation/assembly module TamB domain-containing protein [Sphingomonas sp.]|uniref:translocation/assembly module TamB domain-containing protein n=1 Tax=Sphingomonas sp. TaxID=28214 RepID=UPI003B3A7CBB